MQFCVCPNVCVIMPESVLANEQACMCICVRVWVRASVWLSASEWARASVWVGAFVWMGANERRGEWVRVWDHSNVTACKCERVWVWVNVYLWLCISVSASDYARIGVGGCKCAWVRVWDRSNVTACKCERVWVWVDVDLWLCISASASDYARIWVGGCICVSRCESVQVSVSASVVRASVGTCKCGCVKVWVYASVSVCECECVRVPSPSELCCRVRPKMWQKKLQVLSPQNLSESSWEGGKLESHKWRLCTDKIIRGCCQDRPSLQSSNIPSVCEKPVLGWSHRLSRRTMEIQCRRILGLCATTC